MHNHGRLTPEMEREEREEMLAALTEDYGEATAKKILADKVSAEEIAIVESTYAELKKTAEFDLDAALDSYDPTFPGYTPSEDAFEFFTLMRLVAGEDFEFNTPIAHYFMADLLLGHIKDVQQFPYSKEVCDTLELNPLRIGIMASRGLAKALPLDYPVMSEYGNKTIGNVKIGDKIYDGNGQICRVTNKSEVFVDKPMYRITLLDGREIDMSEDHISILWKRAVKQLGTDKTKPVVNKKGEKRFKPIKLQGLKEINITAKELYESGVLSKRTVSDKQTTGREFKYFMPNVGLCADYPETHFEIDPYTVGVILGDGSVEQENGYTRITCHDDDYEEYKRLIPYPLGKYTKKKDSNCGMFSLLGLSKLVKKFVGIDRSYTKKVPEPLKMGSRHQRLEVLRGLMDTDGSVYSASGTTVFDSTSKVLAEDVQWLVRSLGGSASIKENKTPSPFGKSYRVKIQINENIFKLPRKMKKQQYRTDKLCVPVVSIEKIENRPTQCITVDSPHASFITKDWTVTHNSTITISFFTVYSAYKGELPNGIGKVYFYLLIAASSKGGARVNALAVRAMCEDSVFLKDYFEDMRFTETETEFVRKGNGPRKNRSFLIRYQGYSTGIRGSRYGERRPDLLIFDDAILNTAAAYSKVISETLDEVIHADAVNALKGGGKGRVILCFTPFHYGDVNTKALTQGAFTQCVIPMAKKFDADSDKLHYTQIQSSWEAMHPANSIVGLVRGAKKAKKLKLFMQERQLRLTSGADRLVPDNCIQFCDMKIIADNIHAYNIYITTDYTTTSGENSDFSGVATWAVGSNEDWFLLSLTLRKRGIQEQYNATLDEASYWKRKGKNVEIGVEIDGSQAAHIHGLEKEMMRRGEWFSFAKDKNNPQVDRKGILSRSTGVKKHERFRIAVEQTMLRKKVWLPEHLKDNEDMKEFLQQIKGATHENFTRADDGPDLITMLNGMVVYLPTEAQIAMKDDEYTEVRDGSYYYTVKESNEGSAYDNY